MLAGHPWVMKYFFNVKYFYFELNPFLNLKSKSIIAITGMIKLSGDMMMKQNNLETN